MTSDRMTLPDKVQAKLTHLERLNYLLLIIGAAAIVAFGSFAIYEIRELQSHTTELEQLTNDLCGTLRRAGILISGSEENPCEP